MRFTGWLRRVQQDDPKRGTLALVNGSAILGLPHGFTGQMGRTALEEVDRWMDRGAHGILTLPFPVDVVDLRR